MAQAFSKTPPHWLVRDQDDYDMAPDIRRAALAFRLEIADYRWRIEDVCSFLLNDKDEKSPQDNIPYDVYQDWIQKIPVVSDEMSHIFNAGSYAYSEKERHYLLTQAFQETWRCILFSMQELLIQLLLPQLN